MVFIYFSVPRSNTAHQNRLSHVYYKRRNATVEAMEDYEIRDVMNRSKTPIIDIDFTLLVTKIDVTQNKTPFGLFTANKIEERSTRYEYTLKFRAVNNGQIHCLKINNLSKFKRFLEGKAYKDCFWNKAKPLVPLIKRVPFLSRYKADP